MGNRSRSRVAGSSEIAEASDVWLPAAFARRPTCRSQLMHLLGRPEGATLEQIMQLTGWNRDRAGWFRNYLGRGVRVAVGSRAGARIETVKQTLAL